MWCSWWSTVSSLTWENITEIKVSNPARTQVKTACLLLGQHTGLLAELCYGLQSKWSFLIYHMTKGLNSVRGCCFFTCLNIQFWIQDIVRVTFLSQISGENVSSCHTKNLTFKMFSTVPKWTCPLGFSVGLFSGPKYSEQFIELKRQSRKEGEE